MGIDDDLTREIEKKLGIKKLESGQTKESKVIAPKSPPSSENTD